MVKQTLDQASKIHNIFIILFSGAITLTPFALNDFNLKPELFKLSNEHSLWLLLLIGIGLIYYELSLYIESYWIDDINEKKFKNVDVIKDIKESYFIKNWYEFLLLKSHNQSYIHHFIKNIAFRLQLWITTAMSLLIGWIIFIIINKPSQMFDHVFNLFINRIEIANSTGIYTIILGTILLIVIEILLMARILQLSAFLYILRYLSVAHDENPNLMKDNNPTGSIPCQCCCIKSCLRCSELTSKSCIHKPCTCCEKDISFISYNGECVAEQPKATSIGNFILAMISGLVACLLIVGYGIKIIEYTQNNSTLSQVIKAVISLGGLLVGFAIHNRLDTGPSHLIIRDQKIINSNTNMPIPQSEKFNLIKGQIHLTESKRKFNIPNRFKNEPEKLVAFMNEVQENR